MSGVERAEQAEPEPEEDEPNPPYDLPTGVNSWAEWMDR